MHRDPLGTRPSQLEPAVRPPALVVHATSTSGRTASTHRRHLMHPDLFLHLAELRAAEATRNAEHARHVPPRRARPPSGRARRSAGRLLVRAVARLIDEPVVVMPRRSS
ncbi:hypothetical protein FTX61_09825 [Nitriliruptoraceae bacterium ZYF776]|nr:hypothetical protein [Profundirhabdus halotolerans]